MYHSGKKDQRVLKDIVYLVANLLRGHKHKFDDINPIPKARTPIVQVYHLETNIDCDLSFTNGLSVMNTRFVSICINIEPELRPLVLFLKKWSKSLNFNMFITSYALTMLVIYFMQVHGILPSVHYLKEQLGVGATIDGKQIKSY